MTGSYINNSYNRMSSKNPTPVADRLRGMSIGDEEQIRSNDPRLMSRNQGLAAKAALEQEKKSEMSRAAKQRPNESLEQAMMRASSEREYDRKRSAEQKSIGMDPNKSKYMSPREKGDAMSETGFQQKYGAFQVASMGGGGGGRETSSRAPQGRATYNPGKSEDMRNSTFAQWDAKKAKEKYSGNVNPSKYSGYV
jgi:hypothetical protein